MNLPLELLLGLYLGALTGVLPALAAWGLGFSFRYFTGVTIPGTVVMVFCVAVAGVQGGLMGILDPSLTEPQRIPFVVALLVVMMGSLYAHNQGDRMGASLPRRLTLKRLRERTLSADVVEQVGGFGQVRVRPAGRVHDVEGYPPLPERTRDAIADGEWTFPADLPVSEIENRLADRLTTDHNLSAVSVALDTKGRATIEAAPATGGLSRRVPTGTRAVSVDALLPAGVAPGDEVVVSSSDATASGPVLSVRTDGALDVEQEETGEATDGETEGEDEAADLPEPRSAAPAPSGGDGRVTVALAPRDARALLAADGPQVAVRAQGTRRDVELTALLKQAGAAVSRLSVREGGPLDGRALGSVDAAAEYGVVPLALASGASADGRPWDVAPAPETVARAGDELLVAGPPEALARFEEAAA